MSETLPANQKRIGGVLYELGSPDENGNIPLTVVPEAPKSAAKLKAWRDFMTPGSKVYVVAKSGSDKVLKYGSGTELSGNPVVSPVDEIDLDLHKELMKAMKS